MGCLGNLLWFLLGGCISGLSWCLAGVLWCITIVGIGKEIRYGGGAGSLLLNIIWILVSGLPLAIESAVLGCLLCVTIIGIPFGLQHFKIAKLALMPFGSEVV